MKAPEIFYQFLVENGALFVFLEKLNEQKKHMTLQEYCNSIDFPFNYVLKLKWEREYDFWWDLDDKWKHIGLVTPE